MVILKLFSTKKTNLESKLDIRFYLLLLNEICFTLFDVKMLFKCIKALIAQSMFKAACILICGLILYAD